MSQQPAMQDLASANQLGQPQSAAPQSAAPQDDLSSMIGPSGTAAGNAAGTRASEKQGFKDARAGLAEQGIQTNAVKDKQQAAQDKQQAAQDKQEQKAESDKLKQQGKMDAHEAKQGNAAAQGTPFSQMYGAGAGIGSSMTQETGGVGPTAAFAAQRAHQLLNPDLKPHTAPAFAGTGTGARTKDQHSKGTASALAPGMGKSVESLLGI